ncbi:hypothetical protein ORJ04_21025 [Rheinheimera baltica]|uniref:Uncharacterized protein n=1 Tax=Rheinheimera baltica TaxID=67576 RepID=A0ABT9I4W5_9GAMM|nr:hypothetical protein [Rheinheimera baltica]MDP5138434.1 hypothetical protein [Rheinheimera baltica]
MTDIFFLGCDDGWKLLRQAASPQLADKYYLINTPYNTLDNSLASGDQVVVLYSLPQNMVARHIGQLSLSEALELWQRSVQALLQTQRKHRRQLKLICFEDALQNGLLEADSPKLKTLLAGITPPKTPSLLALISEMAIQQNHELKQLTDLLFASSLATKIHSHNYACNWLEEYEQLKSKQLAAASLERQLGELQQELTKVLNENKVIKRSSSILEAEVKSLRDQSAKQIQITENYEQLQLQLLQVQAELEQYYVLYKQQQQSLKQCEEQSIEAQRQATARQNSQSLLQKQAERELMRAQGEIERLRRQLAGVSLTGHQAIAELKTVKNSTMWKALAPVRKLTSTTKKKQLQLQKDISLIRSCALFDQKWYMQNYPDVEQSGADAIEHYLQYGAKEGRAPGPDFDGNWYLSHYPDIGASGINPLIHYIKFGQLEGRQTSPKLLQLIKGS